MTDIVDALRDITPKGRDVSEYHQDDLLILQAADEIERLREALRPLACECVNYCLSLENEGLTFMQDCPRFKARAALGEGEE